MAAIDISSAGGGSVSTGVLQLQNGVAMDSTLRNVADQSNTTSPLKLSTSGVQVASTLQITTNSDPYIDAEDGAGNNRFTVGRDPSSQVVNIDFASNPTGGTNMVGGIRTYTDGVNLAQVMSFRKDGYIGVGTTTPTENLQVQGNVFSGGGTKLVLTGESFALQTIVPSGAGGMVIGTNANNPSFIDILSANQFFHISNRASSNRLGIYSATFVGTTATYSSELLTLTTGGSLGIGETAPSARVQIKGSGSTSATTSLLVQNSSGTDLFKVFDDGQIYVPQPGGQTMFIDTIKGYANSYVGCRSGFSCGSNIPSIVASAALQVNSTTQGFLPPRMTNAQRSAIASPAEGLQIHNTTNNGVAYYDGTNWGYLSGAKQSITITGATQTIFGGNGNIVALTMQSSTTLTFSNHVVGTYIFQITQGGTGSYTITWPVSVLWSGGTAPTLTTTVGKTDIVTLFHDGTNFYGTYSLNY